MGLLPLSLKRVLPTFAVRRDEGLFLVVDKAAPLDVRCVDVA
jgi:hypothetical protein